MEAHLPYCISCQSVASFVPFKVSPCRTCVWIALAHPPAWFFHISLSVLMGQSCELDGGAASGCVEELPVEVIEIVLALLPIRAVVRAAAVCKHWKSIISSSSFASLRSRVAAKSSAWFMFCGVNYSLPCRDEVTAFDPETGMWVRLPCLSPPPHNRSSLAGMNGIVFALVGVKEFQLCYAPSVVKPLWKLTPPMKHPKHDPLIAVIGHPQAQSHKLIVTGSVEDGDPLSVEVYDAASNNWEPCPSLPTAFGKIHSRYWMSCVVHKEKYYISKNHTGDTCVLSLDNKIWSSPFVLRPPGVSYSFLLSCGGMLLLVGLHKESQEITLRLWQVDEEAMGCREVCTMPSHLLNLFCNLNGVAVKCAGGGCAIYIYSDSMYNDYVACKCEMRKGGWAWSRLPRSPPLPPPSAACSVNGFEKVICLAGFPPLPVDASRHRTAKYEH